MGGSAYPGTATTTVVPLPRTWQTAPPHYHRTVHEDLLGEYLRARRGQLQPADVGFPVERKRRVPGLRREEVALLAGISADYYLKLEQGRGGRPSEQVLRSLARALKLDDPAVRHLLELAGLSPDTPTATRIEQVPESVLNLLESIDLPTFITNHFFDVLAANGAAHTISPEIAPGRNRVRSLFLVESEQQLFSGWEQAAPHYVAVMRDVVRRNVSDPAFVHLLEELTVRSPLFRGLWERHDILPWRTQFAALNHPTAGQISLYLERLSVPGETGLCLFVFHPRPGSDDAVRLSALLHPSTSTGAAGDDDAG